MDTKQAPTKTFMNKRQVLALENEALGLPNVDHDRTRERPYCSPGMLEEVIHEARRDPQNGR